MSVESLAIVLHHSKATGTDKVVMIGIANHDGDGGSWPAIVTLATYANVDPRAVKKSIRRLEAIGEVRRHVQDGGTRHMADYARPNRYEILVRCPANCDRTMSHRTPKLSTDAPKGGVSHRTPGVLADTGGVSAKVPRGGYLADTQTSQEPPFKSGLAHSVNSPGAEALCWSCAKPSGHPKKRYCVQCESAGLNNSLISCDGADCNTVKHRDYPGQAFFDCGQHEPDDDGDEKQKAAFDGEEAENV